MTQPPPPPFPPPPPPPFAPPPFPPPGASAPRRGKTLAVVLAVVVALVLVAAAVVVPLLLTRDDDEPGAGPSDLSAVKSYSGLTNKHVPLGESLDYPQSPPVGGDHAPVWIECGAYDEPLPEVNAVHDLEHGTTVLHYLPGLPESDLEVLASKLPDNGIMAPYPGLRAPVVVTVWGRQLDLLGASDPRLDLFIKAFGNGETAPEPFASCHGGVSPEQATPPGVSAMAR